MAAGLNMIPETYVFCPRCAARVDTGRVQIGGMLSCHFCGHEFQVARGRSSNGGAGQGGDKKTPPPEPKTTASHSDLWADKAIGPAPPPGLLLAGVFGFPLRLNNLLQTLSIAAAATVLLLAVRTTLWCAAADAVEDDQYHRVLLWNGLLFAIPLGLFASLLCGHLASAFGLTVLHETSHGADSIESWPRVLLLEDIGAAVYVAFALLLAALPGILTADVWQRFGVPEAWAILGPIPICFPPLLFSMLEGKSPLSPFSPRVWMSILRGWRVWTLFYILSVAAVGATTAALIFISRHDGAIVGVAASGLGAAFVWMVYFRLLGRLAWYCSGRWKKMHDFAE